MNNTCANCGGFIGNFVYVGDGAKTCNCYRQKIEGHFGDADACVAPAHSWKADFVADSPYKWVCEHCGAKSY